MPTKKRAHLNDKTQPTGSVKFKSNKIFIELTASMFSSGGAQMDFISTDFDTDINVMNRCEATFEKIAGSQNAAMLTLSIRLENGTEIKTDLGV